jgi:hypothetical protein
MPHGLWQWVEAKLNPAAPGDELPIVDESSASPDIPTMFLMPAETAAIAS